MFWFCVGTVTPSCTSTKPIVTKEVNVQSLITVNVNEELIETYAPETGFAVVFVVAVIT